MFIKYKNYDRDEHIDSYEIHSEFLNVRLKRKNSGASHLRFSKKELGYIIFAELCDKARSGEGLYEYIKERRPKFIRVYSKDL